MREGRIGAAVVPASFRFDRTWRFDVPVAQLWAQLTATDEFPRWWSWLSSFDAPEGLAAGSIARAVIRAPLPYTLRLQIAVDHVVSEQCVEATVHGDLRGPASLQLASEGGSSHARICWDLQPQGVLRAAAVFGRPAMVWAHDRVITTGVDQFRERALGEWT